MEERKKIKYSSRDFFFFISCTAYKTVIFVSLFFYYYECAGCLECSSQIKELVAAQRDRGAKYSGELECLSLSLSAHPLQPAGLGARKQFNLFTTV